MTRRLRALLRRRVSQASDGAIRIDLLGMGTPPGTVLRKSKTERFRAPRPFGGVFKPARVLTLSCPGKAVLGQVVKVSGTVSPARANAPITITYHGSKDTITHQVSTDPGGSFTDSASPDALGSWSIRATYAGDRISASSSPSCSSFVEPGA